MTRKRLGSLAFLFILVITGVVFRHELVHWFSFAQPSVTPAATLAAHEHAHYTCPMHPSVNQDTPGKCPICGMDLVRVTTNEQEQNIVTVDAARRQLIGVRVGEVVSAPFERTVRAVGQVNYDESALSDVTLKVRGFITKLFVNRAGQRVARGQPLFELYSPDLFSAEQDFVLANRTSAELPLSAAARQRLRLLGLEDGQIDALAKQGAPAEHTTISAPASGFVIEKNVVEGAAVEAGMRLYRIAKLDRVWVEAEVYEADLALVHPGQSATVTLDYLPERAYQAKVSFVYPYVDSAARTARVRIELANREFELRPGMYATVILRASAGERVQVPAAAVVYTGPRRLVFVDIGEGRFRAQEVHLGGQANGMFEVLSGLSAGERVATSGVFLIAAEARIRNATQFWSEPNDAGAP